MVSLGQCIVHNLSQLAPTLLTIPTSGMVEHLPASAYHSHHSLSHSLLRHLEPLNPPLQFWHHSWMNPGRPGWDEKTSEPMHFGRAMHDFMEDPHGFTTRWTFLPQYKSTTKPGCIGSKPGGQWDLMRTLNDRLMRHDRVREAVANGTPEVSVFAQWELPQNPWRPSDILSVPVRCRPDMRVGTDYRLHWKFVHKLDPFSIGDIIVRYRYDQAAAWYREVERLAGTTTPKTRDIFYFVEKSAPHKILPLEFPAAVLETAHNRNDMAVQRYAAMLETYGTDPWPDFPTRPERIVPFGEGGHDSMQLPARWDRMG